MKRLFIGFKVEPIQGQTLISIVKEQKPELDSGIRWTIDGNFHVTSHFLGDTETDKVPAIISAMHAATKNTRSIHIQIEKIALFPHYKSTILAAYIAPNDILRQIHDALPFTDKHEYSPHITLTRGLKKNNKIPEIAVNYSINLNQFILYDSQPTQLGSIYTPIETILLN